MYAIKHDVPRNWSFAGRSAAGVLGRRRSGGTWARATSEQASTTERLLQQ